MATRELFPIVACLDLGRARGFYAAVFGAVEHYRFPDEGDPVYISLTIGASTIALADATGPTAYGEPARPATGHAVDLCVYVDDLEPALARGAAVGGAIVAEPERMPWGERVAWLRDPEGTMLLVIQA